MLHEATGIGPVRNLIILSGQNRVKPDDWSMMEQLGPDVSIFVVLSLKHKQL